MKAASATDSGEPVAAKWNRDSKPDASERAAANLSAVADTLPAMNVDIWLPPVLAAVIGALLSPSIGKGLLMLAEARACRIKHVRVDGAELYANGRTANPDAALWAAPVTAGLRGASTSDLIQATGKGRTWV